MKIKNLLALSVAAFLLAAVCFPQTAAARALNRNDKRRIECAMFKMRVLAEMFDVRVPASKKTYTLPDVCPTPASGNKTVQAPKWFLEGYEETGKDATGKTVTVRREAELARMDKNKVVYVPKEGTFSEVDLWRQAFSNVYLYLDRANTSMDPSQPVSLDKLSRGYVRNRIN